jgi:hypothetical protein
MSLLLFISEPDMPRKAAPPSVGALFESKVSAAEFARFKQATSGFQQDMMQFKDEVLENMVSMEDLRDLKKFVNESMEHIRIARADNLTLRLRETEKNVENLSRTVDELEYLVKGESGVFLDPDDNESIITPTAVSSSSDSWYSTSDSGESDSDSDEEDKREYYRRRQAYGEDEF